LVIAAAFLIAGFFGLQSVRPDASQSPPAGQYRVIKVVDGDTLDVIDSRGDEIRIRLIGIDTPESVDPRQPVECFGAEAAARARELLDGAVIELESDPTQGDADRFDRRLRYVWLSDGTNVNLKLIEDGYALEYTYDEPYRYQSVFQLAEDEARQAGRGLWSPKACDGSVNAPA